MAQWTKEQQEVISSRGKNQLVSAAAGSGKTAVLITRIVELIKEGSATVEGLLVVTFTKAAAAEMKERLHKELSQELEKATAQNAFIRQQISALPKAQISTIHSFCKEVIMDHFQVLGLDPNFKVGASSDIERIQDQVMDKIFEKAYQKSTPVFLETLEAYTKAKSDSALRTYVKKVYEFSRTHVSPEAFLQGVLDHYSSQGAHFWETQLTQVLDALFKGLIEAYEESLSNQNAEGFLYYTLVFEEDLKKFEAIREALEVSIYAFQSAFSAFAFQRMPVIGKKIKETLSEEELEKLEELKSLRDDLKAYVKKRIAIYCDEPFETQLEDIYRMGPYIHVIVELVQAYDKAFMKQKMSKGLIDFSDLEHFAITLLRSDDVAEVYKNRFDYVFTDEYQDSNRVQEYILSRVSRSKNRFMVGDLKQSIYKFRLADPTLFIETYKAYSLDGFTSEKHDLNRNFRSAKSIIDFINCCFRPLMREDFGGIDYDDKNQLYPGASFDFQVQVEIHLLHREGEKDDEDILELPEKAYAEAVEAADYIGRLVGKEYYFDAKKNEARLIQLSDIVVLMRSIQGVSSIYREVFFERQIPLYTESQTGYFDAVEVEIFIQFLRLIDNITLDLPLMSTMKSTIGGFSVEELIQVRVMTDQLQFYDCVVVYSETFEDLLAQKLQVFLEKIMYFQALSRQQSLDTFIWRLLLETDYYYSLGALYLGESKQANLRLLVSRAKVFLDAEKTSLHAFINHIDELSRKEVDFSEARLIHEKDDVVKLMTIHKSKGLEYPVVILAGLGKKFNEMDMRDALICHEGVGISTGIIDPQLRYKKSALSERIVKYLLRREMLEEELRILYVAMTRGIHRLVLIGSVQSLSKSAQKWSRAISGHSLFSVASLLDFVMLALKNEVFSQHELRTLIEKGSFTLSKSVSLSVYSKAVGLVHMPHQSKRKIIDRQDFYQALLSAPTEIFADYQWSYAYESAVALPMKISVTEYKNRLKAKNNDPYHILELSPLAPVSPIGGAERGTQIHSLLEHFTLPYEDFDDAFEKTSCYLIEKNLLSGDILKTISKKDIKSFFESSIGLRMQKAKGFYREQAFVLQLDAHDLYEDVNGEDKVLLQGVIDLYFEEEDGLVLVDYKSDQLGLDQQVYWNERYGLTLSLYQKALEILLDKPVKEKYIYSTYNQDFVAML